MVWLWTRQPQKSDEENVSSGAGRDSAREPATIAAAESINRNGRGLTGTKRTSQDVFVHPLHEKISERAMADKEKASRTDTAHSTLAIFKSSEEPSATRQGTLPMIELMLETIPKDQFRSLERGLIRKLDLIIMPLTMFLYLFSFLDKSIHSFQY
jgi:hypothetical protein